MPNVSDTHLKHDPLLVAALAAGDLSGADRDEAGAQIATCTDCAALHADLLDIARATAALPPAVAPRDFTLSPAQAAALRPGGWRGLVAAIAGSRPLMSRQLGIGLATIGLAGLLVSTLPTIQVGSPAAAPVAGSAADNGQSQTGAGAESGGPVSVTAEGAPAAAAPSTRPSDAASARLAPAPNATKSSDGIGVFGGMKTQSPVPARDNQYDAAASGAPETLGAAAPGLASTQPPPATPDGGRGLLVAASALLIATGLVLLVIRRLARRPAWN